MPKKTLMGWDGHPQYRWKKMYRGTMYRVTCDELGTKRTKEDSVDAANFWWQKKLAELTIRTPDPDKEEAHAAIQRKMEWAANNEPELLPSLKQVKKDIETNPPDVADTFIDDGGAIAQNIAAANLFGIDIPPDLEPIALQHFFGDKRLWGERFAKSKKIDKDKTLAVQLKLFLEVEKLRLAPQSYIELSQYLNFVAEKLGNDLDTSTINETTVETHWKWLAGKKWEYTGKNKRLGFFRRFITALVEKRICPMPLNLKSKSHRFKGSKSAIYNEDLEAVFNRLQTELAAMQTPFKLWALLGLNCGMTQDDWGSLTWEQINWKKGTLTRKRVKLKDQPNAPIVTYKLWPETLELLKPFKKESGLVFTTKDGEPMYVCKYKDGEEIKGTKKDLFSTYWNRTEPEMSFSPGEFRSLGSTLCKKNNKYSRFATVFLANVPASITDIHYSAEWEQPFFEALDFLHSEIFPSKKKKAK